MVGDIIRQLTLFNDDSDNMIIDSFDEKRVSYRKKYYNKLKNKNFGFSYDKRVTKSGKYGFPLIKPYLDDIPQNFVSLGDIKKVYSINSCVTGFEYDYVLDNLWYKYNDYLPVLLNYMCVCNPDFSMYVDCSIATQISNKLRSHEIAYKLQENGIQIMPCISWSSTRSYDFCFEGFSKGGVVIVSSIGTLKNEISQLYFKNGFLEMLNRLSPDSVILYGDALYNMDSWRPKELEIKFVKNYRLERARKHGK